MAETAKQSEQSMEEILQSIKRIIAEEDPVPEQEGSAASAMAQDVADSEDILELTEQVSPDTGDDSPIAVDALLDSLATENVEEPPQDDAALAEASATEKDKGEPVSDDALEALNQAMMEESAAMIEEDGVATAEDEGGLVSDQALAASAAALKQLKPEQVGATAFHTDKVAFRSGMTLEDLVLESMRPMLRDWLDSNLPQLVEKLVAREIAKIRNQLD